jgi:hypothetical protein
MARSIPNTRQKYADKQMKPSAKKKKKKKKQFSLKSYRYLLTISSKIKNLHLSQTPTPLWPSPFLSIFSARKATDGYYIDPNAQYPS